MRREEEGGVTMVRGDVVLILYLFYFILLYFILFIYLYFLFSSFFFLFCRCGNQRWQY